jgi:acetyl esterase/lipase
MRMDPRLQLFTRALRLVPGVSIADMDLAAIARAQAQGYGPDVPGRWIVTGRPAHDVDVDHRHLPGPDGELRIRRYRRRGAPSGAPLLVHFHGGGWTLGTLESGDWLCSHVAARTGAVVASVEYRLAPQHPYPAAREDCAAATSWLVRHAEDLGADAARVGVMGDSAGGNLAAVVALVARDAGGPDLGLQVLIYPGTDLTLSSPSIEAKADAPILTRADIAAFTRHYLGEGDPKDPYVSPLHASTHAGLPPALVQTAEHDPLLDDGRRYAEALEDAGVAVRYTEYVGVPHGWISFPGVARQVGEQALAEVCAAVDRHLG